MKEYAIEQRRFNEKVFGRGTRSIDSVEGLLNKYAREGWRLHTMMTSPTRDEKTQLTTMVFERDIPDPSPEPVRQAAATAVCPKCGSILKPSSGFCTNCGTKLG